MQIHLCFWHFRVLGFINCIFKLITSLAVEKHKDSNADFPQSFPFIIAFEGQKKAFYKKGCDTQ